MNIFGNRSIMRVGILHKSINFNSGLNIYGIVVFSNSDCL